MSGFRIRETIMAKGPDVLIQSVDDSLLPVIFKTTKLSRLALYFW